MDNSFAIGCIAIGLIFMSLSQCNMHFDLDRIETKIEELDNEN